MLPWSNVGDQIRSIQKTAGDDYLPPSADNQASESMAKNASMTFEDVEVGKVYEGRVVRSGKDVC